MLYLHKHNIIHRDLSTGNIFIDDKFFPNLIISFFTTKINKNKIIDTQIVGESSFIAPETWLSNEYSKATDVYTFSMLVYNIVTELNPFNNLSQEKILYKISYEDYRPEIDVSVASAYKNLIVSCWNPEQNERPSFDEIVENLKTNKDFITDDVDEVMYLSYIKYIDEYLEGIESTFDFNKRNYNQDPIYDLLQALKEKEDEKEIEKILHLLTINEIDLNKFEIIDFVEEGGYGDVYKIKEKNKTKENKIYAA